MSIAERYRKIQRILRSRRQISFDELQCELEVSRATLFRDLAYLRDRLGVPLVYDRESGRYSLDRQTTYQELPGLWLTAEEIYALLSMRQLLANLDPGGILGPYIDPLKERLAQLLGSGKHEADEVAHRIVVLSAAARHYPSTHFQQVAAALMERKRLLIDYQARGSGTVARREISPQRLLHYRENWYLEAWCHLRNQLRNFAVDAIRSLVSMDTAAQEVPLEELAERRGAGYGIFAGQAQHQARLRFTPARARWVACEQWHPDQTGEFLPDGSYLLTVPYGLDHELTMDILKYGPDCEVVGPGELREKVMGLLRKTMENYARG